MSKPKRYEVYDLVTGNLLTEGIARYCAEVLGVTADTIRSIANSKYSSRKYEIVEVDLSKDKPAPQAIDHHAVSAARQWDAFCEPIRRKYGIPVYKAPKEEDDK